MRLIQECKSSDGIHEVEIPSASDPDVLYLVLINPWDRNASEVVCECPSYIHRGYCHHQAEAFATVCRWVSTSGKAQTAEQAAKKICPECGGPTRIVIDD